MTKLIKLEFDKGNLRGTLRTSVIILISCIGIAILGGCLGNEFEEEADVLYGADMLMLGSLILRVCFGIFAGVLIARLIISEYQNKTIHALFTYPVPRKKIIAGKLLIVFFCTFLLIILADLLFGAAIFAANTFLPVVEDQIAFQALIYRIPGVIFSAFMTAGLSLISLYFGMKKKSASSTIVAAVVINLLVNSNINIGSENAVNANLFVIPIIPILLCLAGIFIAYLSYRDIESIDL